jgi:transcriptional regulator of arginine metabolism
MAAEIHASTTRRAAILRLIRESVVHNQEDLVKALRKLGIEATQSSVSRDLRELGVAKAGDRYIVPGGEAGGAPNPFVSVANFVTAVRSAGASLTVVKTTTGTAQSVAVAIDAANWPEIVGTISGDDTIFIATNDGRDQRKLRERLRGVFGESVVNGDA